MNRKGFVYILKSPNCSRCYIGSTSNHIKRLSEHNEGKVASTRGKGPWFIAFTQEYDDIKIARKIEYKIKRLKSKILLEKMINEGIIKLGVKRGVA